ncbi:p-hydroxyphenylacetate 3-hydroxylase reductase component [Nitrincola alkalisediminis]|uniref:p-hydroxyphenylacetate 3-hydroxylase reductase component n=1 Tax=Nitrincola alkalisediminis TaxID=1366656 RepID=UPI001874C877|nr:flavin reductase [Nitrincola alkalisediminis]
MSTLSTEFDPKAFRRALGNFATGVTVITATASDGSRAGVTANSFNSVSLDPPLILWSISKNSGSYSVFEKASHFAVNILAADQIHLSNHFARPSDDKFKDIQFALGLGDAAILPDTSACFQCEQYQTLDGGDHWILVGKVVSFVDTGRAPLVYHGGAYSAVIPHAGSKPEKTSASDAAQSKNEQRLADNLYYQMLQAVKRYQADYQPLQLATGLRTIEARMLLTLNDFGTLSTQELEDRIGMPDSDLNVAVDTLCRKGWLVREGNQLSINPNGVEQAETLWRIANDRQQAVFGQFSDEEIAIFRKVLSAI